MRIIAGLLLIVISLLGWFYFGNYQGDVIPYPSLWFIFSIVLGLLGAVIIYRAMKRVEKTFDHHLEEKLEQLKSKSDKLELDFENCEFKSGSFSYPVEGSTLSSVKLFAPNPLSSSDSALTENVIQSYLIYTAVIKGEEFKFISQSFPFDQTTLKYHVLEQNVKLFIDRFNKSKYFFELKR